MGLRKPLPDASTLQACQAALKAAPGDATALVYTCTLVTPMYGGGVKAGVVDTAMPIRATAIRGQLRHWWRLLHRRDADGRPRGAKELFEAERAIWGGLGDAETLAASKVAVRVAAGSVAPRSLQPIATYSHRDGKLRGPDFGNLPGYVLFPGQGKSERGGITEQPRELLTAGIAFRLMLHFDSRLPDAHRQQIADAVRWWATFGGVGARTRRGCGAVEVMDAGRKLVRVSPADVEQQGWRLVLRGPCRDALVAWKQAADAMKAFRQGEGLGRNKGSQPNRPGRSRWPEPDAIRRITGAHSSPHAPAHAAGKVFPRAAFGLPIITHFKDGNAGDPQDTTLKPVPCGSNVPSERMASPLILRPYHDGTGWRPAVLCMDTEHIDKMGVSLEGKGSGLPHTLKPGQWQAGGKAGDIEPMRDRGADAIAAFLAYFGEGVQVTDAVQVATASPPAPARSKTAQTFNGVKLKLMNNGTLDAENQKTRMHWNAIGPAAEQLLQSLPTAKQQELRRGRFIWADIEAADKDILAVRPKA